jgi:regulator of protease activity HflC (stomatin/prohibitin superfamily)
MFQWLGDIINALLEFVPRRVIVRATHGGIRFGPRGGSTELKPGWHIWWPLIHEIDLIPVARQTINTSTQALMTLDGKQVVVGGVIIYRVNNVVQAIGKQNYDLDETVNDIFQAAIVEVITSWTSEKLLKEINGKVEEDLTDTCRKQLRCFGVYVSRAALTDYSECRSLNLLGINLSVE